MLTAAIACGSETIPEFKTEKRTYTNVVIKAVEPDGLRISHDSGYSKVPFNDLTPEQRATYGLTEAKLAEYVQQQNAARIAANANVVPQAPPKRPAVKAETPRYVTPYQIKIYWYNKLPVPRTLDRDYGAAMAARTAFVAEIRAGLHDLTAEKTASAYNKQEALRFGDMERAKLCEVEIARISQQEAEAAKLQQQRLQQQQQQLQSEQTMMQMRRLNSSLESISTDLSQIRGALNSGKY